MNREEIRQQREKLQRELAELDRKDRILDGMSDPQRLAEALHDILCRHNHADGCSWYYEIQRDVPDWGAWAHNKYLSAANRLRNTVLPDMNDAEIIAVARAIKEIA